MRPRTKPSTAELCWRGLVTAASKDREEVALGRAVCASRLTLADARAKILADWTSGGAR